MDDCASDERDEDSGFASMYQSYRMNYERLCHEENDETLNTLNESQEEYLEEGDVSWSDRMKTSSEDEAFSPEDEERTNHYRKAIQRLKEEYERLEREILREKDYMMEELESYREINLILSTVKDDDDVSVKSRVCSHQGKTKRMKQGECTHRLKTNPSVPNMTMSLTQPLPFMDPWFYKKTLRDAEKLFESELQRVKKCISVSSISSHALEPSMRTPVSSTSQDPTFVPEQFSGRPRSSNDIRVSSYPKQTKLFKHPLSIPEISYEEEWASSNYTERKDRGDGGDGSSPLAWSTRSDASTLVSGNGELSPTTSLKSSAKILHYKTDREERY